MTLVRKLRVHPCSKSLLEVESKEHCPARYASNNGVITHQDYRAVRRWQVEGRHD